MNRKRQGGVARFIPGDLQHGSSDRCILRLHRLTSGNQCAKGLPDATFNGIFKSYVEHCSARLDLYRHFVAEKQSS